MNTENTLRTLKLKKAMLLSDIESMSQVDDSLYLQLGKVVAKINQTEKELVRNTDNNLEQ